MFEAGVIRQFNFTLSFAAPESSLLAGVDVSQVVAADARVERTGARPSRGVVARRS